MTSSRLSQLQRINDKYVNRNPRHYSIYYYYSAAATAAAATELVGFAY